MSLNKKKPSKKDKYQYNPYEVSIIGQQDNQKSIFVESLIKKFLPEFKLGHVIDQSIIQPNINNSDIKISTRNNLVLNNDFYSNRANENIDFIVQKSVMLSSDVVIIDQENDSISSKIFYLNESDISEDIEKFENILDYTGDKKAYEKIDTKIPFIENIEEIKNIILLSFKEKSSLSPIYGLVLTGGKSTRMQSDKAFLEYHDKPQYEYTYDILNNFCDKVFISCRKDQSDNFKIDYEQINDTFLDIGPTGGILSAMKSYHDATWVILACDLPFINESTIKYLIDNRDFYKYATAYISSTDNFPEPLCAIYEPKSRARLLQMLSIGYDCPRKFLINSSTKLIQQQMPNSLTNANTPDDYKICLDQNKLV